MLSALVGCGESDQPSPRAPGSSDPEVVHIHGLGRNPADGALMIATHTGLFRIGQDGVRAARVGALSQDTMGFTVVGPDHFLGSGHPDPKTDDPPFLGLIESRDGGERWKPVSLRGEADFHVLEASGPTVYGFGSDWDSREARFLRSDDGGRSWTRLSPPEALIGLAIDPRDPRRIVALGEKRGYLSRDGGSGWRPLDVPGGLVTWTSEVGLVAIDFDGAVWGAGRPEGEWKLVGRVNGAPSALEAVGEEVLAATHDSVILSSRDGGRSWRRLLGP